MNLIRTYAVEHLIDAIESSQPAINVECMIDVQGAIHALQDGVSMATIIRDAGETLERHLIQRVLILTQGNKSEAARRLRMDYKTLYRKLQKYTLA